MIDKALLDPQPLTFIVGVILVLVGLLLCRLSYPVQRFFGLGHSERLNNILDWICALLVIFGIGAILRGSGLRSPFQP